MRYAFYTFSTLFTFPRLTLCISFSVKNIFAFFVNWKLDNSRQQFFERHTGKLWELFRWKIWKTWNRPINPELLGNNQNWIIRWHWITVGFNTIGFDPASDRFRENSKINWEFMNDFFFLWMKIERARWKTTRDLLFKPSLWSVVSPRGGLTFLAAFSSNCFWNGKIIKIVDLRFKILITGIQLFLS